MREDPDVILVGELRDAETISHGDDRRGNRPPRARHAAHHERRRRPIDRIIDALPVEEREQTKSFLSQSLLAVVTQMLVKTADCARPQGDLRSHGDEPRRSRKLIQTDQTHQIPSAAADGQGPRHAAPRPGAARRDHGDARSIPTTRTLTRRTSGRSQRYVTDTTVLPKLDVTGPTLAADSRHAGLTSRTAVAASTHT